MRIAKVAKRTTEVTEEMQGPMWMTKVTKGQLRTAFILYADPDPAVFLNADPDPDPGPGLA